MKMKLGEQILLIEVWSDVVCPWCYLGKHNLKVFLADFADRDSVKVQHRAFRLNPGAHETRTTLLSLGEKYGAVQAQEMLQRVSNAATGAGLSFRIEKTLMGNTLDAHRFLLWAQSRGDGQPLLAVLFNAYFAEAQSIFDHENLVRLAGSVGYAKNEVRLLLETDAFAAEVDADQALAARLGTNWVPFFAVDRKYGLLGAQQVQTFSKILQQAIQVSP
jgi:predicted DsbA family dithiol-disulfide isomerase